MILQVPVWPCPLPSMGSTWRRSTVSCADKEWRENLGKDTSQMTGKLEVYQLSIKKVKLRNSVEICLSASIQSCFETFQVFYLASLQNCPIDPFSVSHFAERKLLEFEHPFKKGLNFMVTMFGKAKKKLLLAWKGAPTPCPIFQKHQKHCTTPWRCPKIRIISTNHPLESVFAMVFHSNL